MRKAAAVCIVLGLIVPLPLAVFAGPNGVTGHGTLAASLASLAESGAREILVFSLSGQAKTSEIGLDVMPATAEGQALTTIQGAVRIRPDLAPAFAIKNDAPPVSLSVFLGRGNGDFFSALYEHYAWRAKFKSMTMGAGLYRDIAITRGIRIRPYVGIIRSHAVLRPSDLKGNTESFEYRLTALCIGLPLVLGFD